MFVSHTSQKLIKTNQFKKITISLLQKIKCNKLIQNDNNFIAIQNFTQKSKEQITVLANFIIKV